MQWGPTQVHRPPSLLHQHPQVTSRRRQGVNTAGPAGPQLPASYIKDAEAPGLQCHKHEDKFLIPRKKMPGDGGRERKMN